MVEHVLENMNEVISNDYSMEHQALDIVSSDNISSDIIALDSGIVDEVVKNIPSTDHNSSGLATYGNYVKIKQNNGKSALYAHMKYGTVNVNKGDYVEKGAIIGTMGSTGNAYGDHLHLEIKNQNNVRENPIISLNEPIQTVQSVNQTTDNIKNDINNQNTKEVIQNNKEEIFIKNSEYNGGSIVDGLKESGIDSSYDYREMLAEKNGIANYRGTYEQNIKLLSLLKSGNLIKA